MLAIRYLRAALLTATALTAAGLAVGQVAAQDATWSATPGSDDYLAGTNWSTGAVPGGTAFFGASTITNLTLADLAFVGGWTFNAGAPSYSFANSGNGNIVFNGAGIATNGGAVAITNNNGNALAFNVASSAGSATITNFGGLAFYDLSTAGDAVITNNASANFYSSASAGNATITNGGTLYFHDNSTADGATITNNIDLSFNDLSTAGSAHITNSGGGMLTFNGNTTAGSATINNTGLLNFNDTSTAGSAAITNNNSLNFLNTSTAGSATITNTSLLTFDDTSTAGRAAITNYSLLYFLNTSTAGRAAITNNNGLDFYHTSTAGNAAITNGGSLYFYHTSTAGNSAITNGGSLYFNNTSTAGNATITNNNGLTFRDTSTAGTASANITNNGLSSFRDTSTAGSAHITNNNNLYFYDTSTAGSAAITNYSALGFYDTSTAGNATITNNNFLAFRETSTAGSAAITNYSVMSFIGTSTAGNAAITNNNNLYFFNTSTAGSAAITNNTGGTVDFSGSTGPTGDNRLTAGSIAGAGDYILGANELTAGSNNLSTNVSGVISGAGGSLVKTGTGTLTIAGINTYTGATTIIDGTLAVNGDLTSSAGVTVNSGGTLGGIGIVGATTIASGGTLAPGNSIGTLTVAGDLTFDAGSTYEVEVDPAGSASDLIHVTGIAHLNGAGVVHVGMSGSYPPLATYTILTADGGLDGTFGAVSSDYVFLTPELSYDLNNVYLGLERNDTAFAEIAATSNRKAVAGAAEGLGAGNAVYDAILTLTDAEAQAAFDALSGEGHATIKGVLIESSSLVLDALLGRLKTVLAAPNTSGAASGYAGDAMLSGESAYSGRLWGQFYGGLGNRAGNSNVARTDFGGGGLVIGTDAAFGDWQLGFSASAGITGMTIPDRATTGTSTDFGVGLYGGTEWGDTGLAFGASLTRHALATTRNVSFPGVIETLTASYGATTGQLTAELNHEFDLGAVGLTPFAQLGHMAHATAAFTEQGGAAALSSAGDLVGQTFATLGVRGEYRFVVGGDGLAAVNGGIAWRHTFAGSAIANNAFAGGSSFALSGTPEATDALLLKAGFSLNLAAGIDFSLAYTGDVAVTGQSHAFTGGLGGQF